MRCDIIAEQSLAVTTSSGGVYRVDEQAGRSFAAYVSFTSAKVPGDERERRSIVNHVVANGALRDAVAAYALRMSTGPTKAHAAHKALLRIKVLCCVQAADEAS